MRLLYAAAEIYPYAKTGGLADVAQALPRALSKHIEVFAVLPLYRFIDRKAHSITPLGRSFSIRMGGRRYRITLYRGENQGVETLFVYEKHLSTCDTPYGNTDGPCSDNALRFGIFSKAIVRIAQLYSVDLLHLNDWHTALAALWTRESLPYFRTLFTIHNLAYQGIFPESTLETLSLGHHYFSPESLEFWGSVNMMKAGIAYSDAVNTVSPRYAEEILQPEFGCGLDGFLRAHQEKLCGILNGIDTELFDPGSDPALPSHYTASTLEGKEENKADYCRSKGFDPLTAPLLIFIGRFAPQKGLDLLIEALPELLQRPLHISIIGEGDPGMADRLSRRAAHQKHLSLFFGYDESLSRRMYAAADFLLMPSSFEPCGLNQLIALRYGTIPIVHRVGGLYDTVRDIGSREDEDICGRGIAMHSYDTTGLIEAVDRALALYHASSDHKEVIVHNMHCDVSFEKSAETYLETYQEILEA